MRRFAWAMLGLGLWVVEGGVEPALGQDPQPTIELQHNRSSPFNPVTTIPFKLSGQLFLKGHRPVVSLRIYKDRKSTRLNSSHSQISYAVFCLKKKNNK